MMEGLHCTTALRQLLEENMMCDLLDPVHQESSQKVQLKVTQVSISGRALQFMGRVQRVHIVPFFCAHIFWICDFRWMLEKEAERFSLSVFQMNNFLIFQSITYFTLKEAITPPLQSRSTENEEL